MDWVLLALAVGYVLVAILAEAQHRRERRDIRRAADRREEDLLDRLMVANNMREYAPRREVPPESPEDVVDNVFDPDWRKF